MELRHLRYFVAVAEEMHLTRAAAKLGIAQPPLTQQIKALEKELGVALFTKSGRGLALTNAGSAFLQDSKTVLSQVHAATGRARDASAGVVGSLRVGFTESASFHPIVTEVFRSFRSAYAAVSLDLQEGHSPALLASLDNETLDLAFVRPPFPPHTNLHSRVIAEEAMLAVLPRDHRLADRKELKMLDLADERLVLYPRVVRPGLADAVMEACQAAGFQPKIGQQTPQLSSTINLVAAGMGVSIVPESMKEVRTSVVSYLPITDLALKAHLGLVGRKSDPSKLVRNFRDLIDDFKSAS